jgi:dihydrolipoamide dehydrogenase
MSKGVNMPSIFVMGGGPAGYAAAIRATQLGASVTLVEKAKLGGTCLNWGCIPTKALVKSAHYWLEINSAKEFGVSIENPTLQWASVQERVGKVVNSQLKGLEALVKSYGFKVVAGDATLEGKGVVSVNGPDGEQKLTADHVIIATGSVPVQLPSLPFDGKFIISSDNGIWMPELPGSMIVVGGGVIGCELAMLYAAFGVKITIVELMPTILPMVDADIVKAMGRVMRKMKIDVITGAKIIGGEVVDGSFVGELDNGKKLTADKCMVVVGRKPNMQGTNAVKLGISKDGRKVEVNDRCETAVPGIWAIGDVTGWWMLAHSAYKMGEVAVANIMGHHESLDGVIVPNGIFTIPEIGTVGMSEAQVREKYGDAVVGTYLYRPLGRAQAAGALEGMFKVIAEPGSLKLLGAAIMGESATDLIAEATIAVQKGLTLHDIAATVHSHPTYAEGFHEACAGAIGCGIHSPAQKKA